jgi:hypothetical protein
MAGPYFFVILIDLCYARHITFFSDRIILNQ